MLTEIPQSLINPDHSKESWYTHTPLSRRVIILAPFATLLAGGCSPQEVLKQVLRIGRRETETTPITPPELQELPDMRVGSLREEQEKAQNLLREAFQLNGNYFQQRTVKSREEIYKAARDIVIRQALLRQQNEPFSPISVKDRLTIEIYRQGYNLKNPHEFVIAAALVDLLLRGRYIDNFRPGNEIFPNAEKLRELVEFEESDAPPFVEGVNLALLSQALQTLKQAGKPTPSKIRLSHSNTSPFDREQGTFNFRFSPNVYSPFNELASFYREADPALFPDFNNAVDEAYARTIQPIIDSTLLFANDNEVTEDREADFVHTFFAFFNDGVGLRKRIDYAREVGLLGEHEILKAKYDTLKNWLGAEISIRGKIKRIDSYGIDDYAVVNDHEPERSGIFLRPHPTLEIDPEWPAVISRTKLKILEGPRMIMDFNNRQATRMWRVEVVGGVVLYQKIELLETQPTRGWISEEWFGGRIPTP